ncbi:MAG: sugar MFS transporter, partial [Cytophagaceae bacterium]|nr:sugar MFS transporter [Cytophagaceae bacterium]
MLKSMAIDSPGVKVSYGRSMAIIGTLFFIFGFVTWLNSVLIPYLQIACQLSQFEAYFVTFAFYIAYCVMAVPSAWVLKGTGFKKGMSLGLVVMAVGALVFIPAAMSRTYILFLIGLFIQGTGLTILQTASNPYITILGPIESAAKRISIMGICNKVAGSIAPIVLGAIALSNTDAIKENIITMTEAQRAVELDALASRVILPYIVMTGVLILLAVMVYLSQLPEVDMDKEDESAKAGNGSTTKTSIFQFPHLILGVIALFLYVGAEVIAGDTIISYGASQGIEFEKAKFFTTCTLVCMLLGYVLGIITIPKRLSQETALKASAVLGILFTIAAVCTSGFTSVLFIALLGLANSLVWP